MTWEIVMGLITLGSALLGVAKLISNNTRAMTEIRCSVEALNDSLKAQRKEVAGLHQTVDELSERLLTLECKGYTAKKGGGKPA